MLSHLKVIELASVLAGPGVGQFFAELGADVIKIESPAGDVTRTWKSAREQTGDRSAYFCAANWGKRSIALDLQRTQDRAVVYKLATEADIVIASYKPGDAEKLAVDHATLAAINPRIIYAQVTGYGPHNPGVGYDAVIQAEAGFMFMNGETGGASLKMPVAMIDVLAGHHLKEGILLALLQRERTGRGDIVHVSLLQAGVASLVNQATNWLVAGMLPQKQGSAHPNIAPYGDVFTTADSKELLLAVGSDRQFQDLCTVLELGPLANDAKYAHNVSRVENRLELCSVLQAQIGRQASAALMEKLRALKVPAGFIRNMAEVFETEEARAMTLLGENCAGVRTVAAMFGSAAQAPLSVTAPPQLNEHGDWIREHGWGSQK